MKPIKYSLFLFIIFFLSSFSIYSQIIQTDPAFPTANDSVIIYYDATQGTSGLEDFSGEIYAHTGVITENSTSSSDWKYVVADWGENIPKIKMERIETNLYKLHITPTIIEYYGVPSGETIEKMAFVFRNNDGTLEGKAEGGEDIFVEVYQSTFNLRFLNPENEVSFQNDPDTLNIKGIADSDSTDVELNVAINGNVVKTVIDDTIEYEFVPATREHFTIELFGTDGYGEDTLSRKLVVNPSLTDRDRPDGLKDGITYIDDNTVRLSLFAPYKEFVYVIGDFNNWKIQEEYFMNKDSVKEDSVYYWIEIPGLTAGEEYAFQYYVDGEIRLADPYSEKILDEHNDPYISDNTYPNLKPYPSGKTEKIAGVLQPGKEEYQWKTTEYERPPQEELVIYELLIRDFLEAHDYKTLIDTLDYLDRLGVNAIELMPIMEFDANESWGYNPTFHVATDKFYGPAKDLKAFIDSCHSRGMAVILDMVLNHAWGPSPLVRLWNEGDYGKPTSENPYLNVEPKHDFNVGYDFNHESAATQYFVDRVNQYWLEEFKFDGFRFDLSKGFTQKNTLGNTSAWGQYDASRVRILKRMADKIREVNESAYVILEHFAENREEKELSNYDMMVWGNMNHTYNEATMGYNESGKSDFSWISYQERGWSNPHVVGYMESHDEERLMYKNLQYGNSSGDYDITQLGTALDRIELAANFFFPIPGPKLMWQFGEVGYDYSIDYECRVCNKPIKWEYYQQEDRRDLYNVFSKVIRLRNKYGIFNTSSFTLSVGGAMKRITLSHDSGDVVILGNFGVEEGTISAQFTSTGEWFEYYTKTILEVSDPNMQITLSPGEFRLYSTQKLKLDNDSTQHYTTSIQSIAKQNQIHVFPNPARDVVHFEFKTFGYSDAMLNIYNLTGQKVTTIEKGNLNHGTHTIQWESHERNNAGPGIYFYELLMGKKRYTGKFLKR